MGIGFAIAAPVGPIGVLCIRRSLSEGWAIGLATGLGAATADALYGAVAGFGLTAVSTFMVGQRAWLSLIGGGFLCYLGARTFVSQPAQEAPAIRGRGLLWAYASTLLLTLTNPMTFLLFAAIFAGLGVGTAFAYGDASALVAGVFLGSAFWWLLLSGAVAVFRSHLSPRWRLIVNRLSGLFLLAAGLYSIFSFWWR